MGRLQRSVKRSPAMLLTLRRFDTYSRESATPVVTLPRYRFRFALIHASINLTSLTTPSVTTTHTSTNTTPATNTTNRRKTDDDEDHDCRATT